MGETDRHRNLMTDLIFALRWFLSNVQAYVAGNIMVYYHEGYPKKNVSPDVFVVLGVPQYERRTYQPWKEGGHLPDVVIEITSRRTAKKDRDEKPTLFAQIGIREYFLFDPFGEYLYPPLQGFRLVNGSYEPMREFPLRSAALGLELRQENNTLRLYDPKTGERLPTSDDEARARRAAEAMQRELELRLKAESEARREEEEARRTEAAARKAAEARADALAVELAQLRAERNE